MPRNLLLAALALGSATVSAQTVNTQVNGLVFTNGLSSLSDSSALYSGPNTSTGVTYLTDNDTTTFNPNIGQQAGGSIQGTFGGAISSSSTGVYLVGMAVTLNGGSPLLYNGQFSVQLQLASGLTASRSYSDTDFTVTSQQITSFLAYQNSNGTVVQTTSTPSASFYYTYVYIPFTDFSTTYDQVLGIKMSNFGAFYPDLSYIGTGYAGTYSGGGGAPVPEPSTYGLALGGLALAVVAARRRAKK